MREQVNEFWERVTPLIKRKYPSIKEFCEKAGLNHLTFYNDKSRRFYPPIDNLKKMAEVLDVSIDYLVFGEAKNIKFDKETLIFVKKYQNARKPIKNIIGKILDGTTEKNSIENPNSSKIPNSTI